MLNGTVYFSKSKYILYRSCDLAQDKPRHEDGEKNQGGIKMDEKTVKIRAIVRLLEEMTMEELQRVRELSELIIQ